MPPDSGNHILYMVFFLGWTGFTVIHLVYAKSALQIIPESHAILVTPTELALACFLVGAISAGFGSTYERVRTSPVKEQHHKMDLVELCMIALHVTTTVATFQSFACGNLVIMYILKSAEPVCLIFLRALVFGMTISTQAWLNCIMAITGLSLASMKSLELDGFYSGLLNLCALFILVANSASAFRNILNKESIEIAGSRKEPSIFRMSVLSLAVLLPIWIGETLFHESNLYTRFIQLLTDPAVMVSAVSNIAYMWFSLKILGLVPNSFFHSIATLAKRLATVCICAYIAQQTFHVVNVVGVAVCSVGLFRLSRGTEGNSSKRSRSISVLHNSSRKILSVTVALLFIYFSTLYIQIQSFAKEPELTGQLTAETRRSDHCGHLVRNYSLSQRPKLSRPSTMCFEQIRQTYFNIYRTRFQLDPDRFNHDLILQHIPVHRNLGDSLITAGEIIFFSKFSNFYIGSTERDQDLCFGKGYNNDNFSVNLFHGGGNFGSIWHMYMGKRYRSVKSFPQLRTIFLPQSSFFATQELWIKDAQRLFPYSQNLQMLFRDFKSLTFLKNMTAEYLPFTERMSFCPDSAFWLPETDAPSAVLDVFLLSRGDREKSGAASMILDKFKAHMISSNITFIEDDWLRLNYTYLRPESLSGVLEFTQNMFDFGVKTLSKGRVIVTDRLHAAILAMVIGRPVIYLDNHYGKTTNVLTAAFHGHPACTWEAMRLKRADTLDQLIGFIAGFLIEI